MSINKQQIQELTFQIRSTSDCAVLAIILPEFLKAVQDLEKSIRKTTQDQLDKILPLLKIPGLNLSKIVGWIKKNVIGQALPQLKAYITLIKDIIEIIQAVEDLVDAIAEIDDKIKRCLLTINPITQFKRDLEFMAAQALGRVDTIQTSINNIIQIPQTIKTNSLKDFIDTVDAGFDSIDSVASTILNTADISNVSPPTLVRSGSILTTTDAQWNQTPSDVSYQYFRIERGVVLELEGQNESTYTITPDDIGSAIKVKVTATNAVSGEEVFSNMINIV